MIDTAVLVFEQSMFYITDPTKFGFRNIDDLYKKTGFDNVKQNPTATDHKEGRYLPCLTLSRRIVFGKPQLALRVQFSVPKSLFHNNFDEVQDTDFPRVVDWLHYTLSDKMGIFLQSHFIEQAYVSTIHYGKNLVFENSYRCQYILKKIENANISQRLGFNKADYKNEGVCIKYHTNSFELAFYDKIKELQQANISPKRSEEKLESVIQLNLLDPLLRVQTKQQFEVLRMEVRLNDHRVIKHRLVKAGLSVGDLTFKGLFKKDIARTVLLNQLDEIQTHYPLFLEEDTGSSEDYLLQFQINNPKATILDTLASYGLKELGKTRGLREIRSMLFIKNPDHWYRFYKRQKSWIPNGKLPQLFPTIRQQLQTFDSIKLINYPFLLLNDDKLK